MYLSTILGGTLLFMTKLELVFKDVIIEQGCGDNGGGDGGHSLSIILLGWDVVSSVVCWMLSSASVAERAAAWLLFFGEALTFHTQTTSCDGHKARQKWRWFVTKILQTHNYYEQPHNY